uniref:Uncharacterized protein n=1 Tax=Caenorhabditis japonica TaxID=281687 RepID=A0A8R1IDV6_CAEJA
MYANTWQLDDKYYVFFNLKYYRFNILAGYNISGSRRMGRSRRRAPHHRTNPTLLEHNPTRRECVGRDATVAKRTRRAVEGAEP